MSEQKNTELFVPSYLLYLLAAVSEHASAQFHARVRESGLRVPEWRVLCCLLDEDGQMITRLAALALMEQSRLTRIIDQMNDRGLVTRREDEIDGRRVRVYLTKLGKSKARKLVGEAKCHEKKLLNKVESIDGQALKASLRSLLDSLEKPQV